ncbi:MAG: glycosyltransferase family 4 protein [Gemmatimonadaceae bacterium]|nr:glycosyltransferase family 4 protein [Gemmatimonadaceae bacterium]
MLPRAATDSRGTRHGPRAAGQRDIGSDLTRPVSASADAVASGRTIVSIFGLEPVRIGGVEAFAREFSAQLAECGWRSVLCFLGEPAPLVREYLELPNVIVEVLPADLKAATAIPAVSRLLATYRPEVLQLQFTPFLSPIPWIAKLRGVDRVFFVDQGSHPAGWTDRGTPSWKRWAARMLTLPLSAVVSISDYNLRVLRSRGFLPVRKTLRLYNAAQVSRPHDRALGNAFRKRHGVPLDRTVVAQVSWMIPEKGIPDLLEAARLALASDASLHFLFGGEGPCRAEYEALASSMGLADRVTFTGLVRDPYGEGLFDAADIVCQMSRWEEAFGYVIAEAMAVNRPVIATRVGAIPELVIDGETGHLVDRGDYKAAARLIVGLAADETLRRRLGLAGRKRAEQEFNVRTNAGEALRLFGIDGRPSRPGGALTG